MLNKNNIFNSRRPLIAILRGITPLEAESVSDVLIEAGIKIIEVPLNSPRPYETIERMVKFHGDKGVFGAGTVLNENNLQDIKNAGATFAVSPGSTMTLAKKAIKMNFPFLPGVSNSSEIMNLLDLGYKSFKFFPAQSAGGINYLKSLSGPFPDIFFCPTGGVNAENATKWLQQKNVICVGGSWIVPSETTDYKEITNRALFASQLVKQIPNL